MTRARVDLIEVADVAKMLGRTPAAIRARVVRGQIPVAGVTPRGARLFRRSDIDAIVQRMQPGRASGAAVP
jgi:helix-turn-helix protein